jgi:hypothetical protein
MRNGAPHCGAPFGVTTQSGLASYCGVAVESVGVTTTEKVVVPPTVSDEVLTVLGSKVQVASVVGSHVLPLITR